MHACALLHLHRDWAHPCHIRPRTGLAAATAAPGLGLGYLLLPHLPWDWDRRAIRAPAPRAALLRHDRRLQAPAAQPRARGASPRGRATPRRLSPQRRRRRCAWAALLQRYCSVQARRPARARGLPWAAGLGCTPWSRLRRKPGKAHSLALGARALALCMRQPCADDVEFILRAAQHQPFPLEPKRPSPTAMSWKRTRRTGRRRRRSMDGRWTVDGRTDGTGAAARRRDNLRLVELRFGLR